MFYSSDKLVEPPGCRIDWAAGFYDSQGANGRGSVFLQGVATGSVGTEVFAGQFVRSGATGQSVEQEIIKKALFRAFFIT